MLCHCGRHRHFPLRRIFMSSMFMWLVCLSGCVQDKPEAVAQWTAVAPKQSDDGRIEWVEVPQTLSFRSGGEGEPRQIITVHMNGPYMKGAWTQHAGAILTLPTAIPAGQPYRVRLQARVLEGPPYLAIQRRWGGTKPWENITLNHEWQTYEKEFVCTRFPTEQVTFSLNPRASGLHTVACGVFELAAIEIIPVGIPCASDQMPKPEQ